MARITQVQTIQTGPGGWGILAACIAVLAGLMVITKVIASAAAALASLVMIVFWLAAGLVLVILAVAAALILHRLHRGQPAIRQLSRPGRTAIVRNGEPLAISPPRLHPDDITRLAAEIVREGRRA